MRTAFLDAVSEDDVRDLAQSLVARGKDGDMIAGRMFLKYALGKPKTPAGRRLRRSGRLHGQCPARASRHGDDPANGQEQKNDHRLTGGGGCGLMPLWPPSGVAMRAGPNRVT
jgi:hypothetical protein